MLYPWQGDWCDDDASDYDDEYLPFHREDVLFDLRQVCRLWSDGRESPHTSASSDRDD